MKLIIASLLLFTACGGSSDSTPAAVQVQEVSFETADGGEVFGNLYGKGEHAVVLAHGAVFNKESWDPFAKTLAEKGYWVLAIDFRGYGKSRAGDKGRALDEDVLAAIRYLHRNDANRVSVIGASMGGGAAAIAATEAREGEIDRLILLSGVPIENPERMQGRKLFIASRGEGLMPQVQEQYERAPEPKKLILLDGEAHAQHIFKTDQAQKLAATILDFLSD